MTTVNLGDLREFEIAPGIRARVVNSDSMSIAHVTLSAGARLPEHSHLNEQVVNVIEGELELTVNGEPRILKPGVVEVLQPNVTHGGHARTFCRVIDAFQPVRQDWLAKMG